MSDREEKFEKMLQYVQKNYSDTVDRMEKLKAEGKTKSATYHQLTGRKLTYQNILSIYSMFGLLDEQNL